ncbi:MAG: hypothetical protein FGM41_11555 [Bacteroidetes bacterium]|nr:hypothetical protein [Bacteroidota bacterium]
MKTKVLILKVALILFISLITTLASAQVATTDVSVNDSLYIVKLTQSNGLYTVTYSLDGKVKLSKTSANFGPTYVFNHLKELWCPKAKLTSTTPSEKVADNDSTSSPETTTNVQETANNDQPPCILSVSLEKDLLNKANKCFIDLTFTYAIDSDVEGQKIATVTFLKKIPVYNEVRIGKMKLFESQKNATQRLDAEIKKLKSPTRIIVKKRLIKCDVLMAEETDTFNAESCAIVFENGFISSIVVSGEYNGKNVRFSNIYGIGITTRQNISDLARIRLYDELGNFPSFVLLNQVIEYSRLIDNYTRDYSPSEITVHLSSNEPEKPVFKSPSTKLFRLNIYSDFIGINEDNPNGLVQIEADKRINLWTKRVAKVSALTFLNPYFEWSKIEQHNRSVQFSEVGGQFYLSPLEVYRYSMIEAGTLLNLLDGDGSVVHAQLNLLPALTFTQLTDSVNQSNGGKEYVDEKINSVLLGLEAKANFSPEKTWSLALSTRVFGYWNLNSTFPYYSINESVDSQKLVDPKRWLNDISMLVTIRTGKGSDNQLFARLGFIHELGNIYNNFAQVQLGYSIYLKASRKE